MNEQRNDTNGPRRGGTAEPGGETTTLKAKPERAPAAPLPSRPDEAPPRPRKGVGRAIFLLLAAGLAVLLYRYWGFWEQLPFWPANQQTTAAAPPPPAVTVAKPMIRELVESKDFTGQFEAVESVDVRARVSGYLESINFTDGQI